MTKEEAIEHGKEQLNIFGGQHREFIEMAIKALKQEPRVDLDELKRKILMEVDGGTDDKWLRYADVCDRISDSIDKYKNKTESEEINESID